MITRSTNEKRCRVLGAQLNLLEQELRALQSDVSELHTFIKQHILNPSDIPGANTPTSYQHYVTIIQAKSTLQKMQYKLTTFDTKVAEGTTAVNKLKTKLKLKTRLDNLDNDHEWGHLGRWIPELQTLRHWRLLPKDPGGEEWGFFDEWMDDIREIHAAAWSKFRETPCLTVSLQVPVSLLESYPLGSTPSTGFC